MDKRDEISVEILVRARTLPRSISIALVISTADDAAVGHFQVLGSMMSFQLSNVLAAQGGELGSVVAEGCIWVVFVESCLVYWLVEYLMNTAELVVVVVVVAK